MNVSGLNLARYTHKNAEGLFGIATEIHAEIYSEPLFESHRFFSEGAFRQRYEMALEQPRFEFLVAKIEERGNRLHVWLCAPA